MACWRDGDQRTNCACTWASKFGQSEHADAWRSRDDGYKAQADRSTVG